MKNLLIILCTTMLISGSVFSQTKQTKKLLAEIEGKWQLDDNKNVTYTRIVELPNLKKDEIYIRALNYFIYNYNSGKSVIQNQDKEGGIIVGKGVFPDVYSTNLGFGYTDYSVLHILRIDIKDGKARIILSLTEYEFDSNGKEPSLSRISEEYPINPKGLSVNITGNLLYEAHMKAIETLDRLEKAIKEGNTSNGIEGGAW